MKELICIVCPNGCHLQVDEENGYAVTGNKCARGVEYGRTELQHPTRVLTSTVRVEGGIHRRCPVKTDRPIPKGQMFAAAAALDELCLIAPVKNGQIVIPDLLGTGANLIVTRDLAAE